MLSETERQRNRKQEMKLRVGDLEFPVKREAPWGSQRADDPITRKDGQGYSEQSPGLETGTLKLPSQ